jgi:hypothetical protein
LCSSVEISSTCQIKTGFWQPRKKMMRTTAKNKKKSLFRDSPWDIMDLVIVGKRNSSSFSSTSRPGTRAG